MEFSINRKLTDEVIIKSLSQFSNIAESDIAIINEIEEILSVNGNSYVKDYFIKGDFPIRLCLFTFKENKIEEIGRLCETLNCKCLVGDRS